MKKIGLFLILGLALGCGESSDDGLTKDDQVKVDRIGQIATASGGDWSKVPDADKKYLVDEVSHGSEQSAKMLLMSKVGAMSAAPGGGPKKP